MAEDGAQTDVEVQDEDEGMEEAEVMAAAYQRGACTAQSAVTSQLHMLQLFGTFHSHTF